MKFKSLRGNLYAWCKKYKIALAVLLVVFILWLFALPKPLFNTPTATVVTSTEGRLMGARIAQDGQWRFPPIDEVPPRFETCILNFEDAYFYKHPGFNAVSMVKAFWQNLTTSKRRGGSTITQQVIRLSRNNPDRTYFEKLLETFLATRLEAGYSKKEILSFYASQAPFGGNVVGLQSASWRYFGIEPSELSWGQAAALAVLPNAPALVFPGKNELIFEAKRNRLLKKLNKEGIIDATTYELAISESLPGKPLELPDIASHFTERLAREHQGERINSSLQFNLQKRVNQITEEAHYRLNQNQIHNLAVLVLDVNTREVLSYVGNAPTTKEHANYVDIISSNRSTGSTLKPFLYAALMGEGQLLPHSLVADVPTSINGYNPQNFDQSYQGAVPASQALARSLNVPAVTLLQEYGLQKFYNKLHQLHFKTIKRPADYYGLSLILGGAESNLWDLTNAYAGLAATLNHFNNTSSEYPQQAFQEPVYIQDSNYNYGEKMPNPEVLDAGAIYKTLEALKEVNRPQGSENWEFFTDAQPLAWKTGTSYGFKDAWAVGVTPKYAIGVWVGNADGEGRPGITGVEAAAPILFDVLNLLPNASWFETPYDELVEASVCTQSGNLAGLYCPETITEWIPKNGTRTTACSYHKQVILNEARSLQVNANCYPIGKLIAEPWFDLPTVWEYYYAPLHPEYKTLPPFAPGCSPEEQAVMAFIFPKKGEQILLPKDFNGTQEVVFKLAHRDPDITVYWYLDGIYVGSTTTFHELSMALKPGKYTISATDAQGNTQAQTLEIRPA